MSGASRRQIRKGVTWLIAGLAVAIATASTLSVLLLGEADGDAEPTRKEASGRSARQETGPPPPPGPVARGETLRIYSSLPLHGPARPTSKAINAGARLALAERGGRGGGFTIKFTRLADSTAAAGKWEPRRTRKNASRAARDRTTIAYIGEFNSGASANSMPILNRAAILQVSPSNTAIGLTEDKPKEALERGEPDRYYPTRRRHYGRVVPNDNVQGGALVSDMKAQGCTAVFVVHDREVYGRGLSKAFEIAAAKQRIRVIRTTGYDARAANYRSLARRIRRSRADCFLGSIIVDNNGVQLFEDVAAANPKLRLWGPDGVAETTFTDPSEGGVSSDVGKRLRVTIATLAPEEYPPKGKKFFEDYEKAYGEFPEPYAIYGYEAMSLILDAIDRAGANGNARRAVIAEFFRTRDRDSVLGTYSIDRNGDTSLGDYGVYTIAGGQLTFAAKVTAAPR